MNTPISDTNEVVFLRGGQRESVHRYSFAVVTDGKTVQSAGDINAVISARSAIKPFVMSFLISESTAQAHGIPDSALALMASSHNGEKQHRELLRKMLLGNGIPLMDLHCGTHLPFGENCRADFYREDDFFERQLYNNCSGKHLSMLLWCKESGINPDGYWQKDHPVQRHLLDQLKNKLHQDEEIPTGVDGCGVPCYFVPLIDMAWLYCRLASDDDYKYVREAILHEPFYLAGSNRKETEIIRDCKIIVKCGSEGVFGAALPDLRTGVFLKVESGNKDAAEIALVKILLGLNGLDAAIKAKLENLKAVKIMSSTGAQAGSIE